MGSPLGRGTSNGGRLQLEKSGGVRPSGGATYPSIPATEVLGVVMPPEEVVTPYPGVCSMIWLHDMGGTSWKAPMHLHRDPGLQQWWQNPTSVAASSSWSRATAGRPISWPRLGGSACRPAATSRTKVAQPDKLSSARSFGKPPRGGVLSVGGSITRREQAHRV